MVQITNTTEIDEFDEKGKPEKVNYSPVGMDLSYYYR